MESLHVAVFCMGSLGGSTEVAVNLALRMGESGHRCDIFAYEDAHSERLVREGIRFHTPRTIDYPLFANIQTDFGFLTAFDKRHKDDPYDLVHMHYAVPLAHVMANIRLIYDLPCVLTFHGSDVTIVPDLMDPNIITRLIHAIDAEVTAASHFLADRAAKVYKLDRSAMHIIPNTVSPEFFKKHTIDRANDPPYFVHCSSLRPVKRAWDIILALCCVRKQHQYQNLPQMPHLKIAGEGPDMMELRVLVEKMQMGDYVHFLGRVDDRWELADLVAASSGLILASLTESQPLVALEAMAVGTPVICSNFSAAPELLGEGQERGYMFEIGDSQALAGVMGDILRDPEEAQHRARVAFAYVRESHWGESVHQQYMDLYKKASERKGGVSSR